MGINSAQMGFIFSAFGWAIVAPWLPGGWLLDRFGSRIVYALSIFTWSVVTILQGFVGFFAGATAIWSALRPALRGRHRRKPVPSRATAASSPPGSRATERHRRGDLQLGPVFRDGHLRADHGLHPQGDIGWPWAFGFMGALGIIAVSAILAGR